MGPKTFVRRVLIVVVGVVVVGSSIVAIGRYQSRRELLARIRALPIVEVGRMDMKSTLTSSGEVSSSNQTTIRCQLEKIVSSNSTIKGENRGSSSIIWLAPDGSIVKKGDVICKLDGSDYEEQELQQKILVQQTIALTTQNRLDLELAETALEEYQKGLKEQFRIDLESRLKLARSDYEKAQIRMKWSEEMLAKGYLGKGQYMTDRQNLLTTSADYENAKKANSVFMDYTTQKELKCLMVDVQTARTNLESRLLTLKLQQSRLEHIQLQLRRCTITAPHDGMLIYANRPEFGFMIEEGVVVRQRMRLFYLPDVSQMEVTSQIHESIVDKIKPGMAVKVRVEALNHREIEGTVVSVKPVPESERFAFMGNEIKNYAGKVKLNSVPDGLRPGMTAEVIFTESVHHDALVIPIGAMRVENGREVCYIREEEGLERRELKIGLSSTEFLEVTSGVEEGDEIVSDPALVDDLPSQAIVRTRVEDSRLARKRRSAVAPKIPI